MKPFSQKYTLVQLLEHTPEGYEFTSTDWPLHVTIVDVFAIDWTPEKIMGELKDILKAYSQMRVRSTAQEDVFFGEERQVQVTLLERMDPLKKLHDDTVSLLKPGGLQLNNPEFAGDNFRPHVTVQKHARLQKGDAVSFTHIALIDMFPNKDPYRRKVLNILEFK